jgi:hypothetical protein
MEGCRDEQQTTLRDFGISEVERTTFAHLLDFDFVEVTRTTFAHVRVVASIAATMPTLPTTRHVATRWPTFDLPKWQDR